jgi:hypothetical protein
MQRGQRAIAPIVAVLATVAVAASAGAGILLSLSPATSPVMPAGTSTYCPFDTGNGMEFPTPGDTGNVSPNATGYADGSVIFSATASGCVPPYTFEWTFGDGTYSTLANVVHVYPGPGYYPGSIAINDSAGHHAVSYFCINATDWPNVSGSGGYPPPPCPG